MELMEGVLCTDPAKRWTAEQVVNSEWFCGPVPDGSEIRAEMQTRK
jgi:hypothetical protein